MAEDKGDIRVLLVEDNPGDARLAVEALRPFRDPAFRVEHQATVSGGLKRLGEGNVDVVLSDLTLPDSLRGVRLPELIQAAADIPVVVLTGSSDEASGVEVLQLGAQDYLLKGEVDGRNLARAIRFAVERRKALAFRDLAEKTESLLVQEKAAVEKLKELEQTRSDFISAVTHELRTPLVSLKGYTSMLQKTLETIPTAETQRMLSVIAANASRLERLVNQVLTVAKMEKGRLALLREGVDLHQLTESCARLMEAQSRKHKIKVERRGQDHSVFCDPFQMEQVLFNLFSNAIKYWPQGGEIQVRVEGLPNEVRVSVKDGGLGIPPGERDRIFNKFERIEDLSRKGIEGSGLGLYLAKEIVTLHGGTITVASKVGEGSTFSFSLPRDGGRRE